MSENKYSRYLDERTSSRYSERLQSAQDRIEWSPIAKVAAAAGLGFLIGAAALSRPGQKAIARMAQHLPKVADTTDLEHLILQRHYDLQKISQSVLSHARMSAVLDYFKDNANVRDAIVDVIKGTDRAKALNLFSSAVYDPGKLADMILSNAGKIDVGRSELISGIRKAALLNEAQRKAAGAHIRFFRQQYDEMLIRNYTSRSPFKHVTAGDILSNKLPGFKFGRERLYVRGKPVSMQTSFQESVLRGLVRRDKRFENLVVNRGLFKTATGEIADLRSVWKGIDKIIEASSEFHIPFVGIGPYHLFNLGKYQERRMMPFMHIFMEGENQFIFPLAKGIKKSDVVANLGLWKLPEDMVYIGGKVYSLATGRVMAENIGLAPSQWGKAARIYAQVSGSVGDLASYEARRQSRQQGWRRVLDWLDIGEQESNSFLDKLANMLRKHKNPNWEGNFLSRISRPLNQNDLIEATNELKRFVHFDSRAIPDELFDKVFEKDLEKLYPGIKFKLDTKEQILNAFETLAVQHGDKISKSFGEEFLTQWNLYTKDPYAFMKGMKSRSNKWPDVSQIGEFLSEKEMIPKEETIKRLIQQELIEQIGERGGRDYKDIASSLIQTGNLDAKGMALDIFMGHNHIDAIKQELDNNLSIISSGAKDYMATRAPWYAYGPMPLTAEKEIARGTEYFMVRESVKLTGKDIIAALNGAEKERSVAKQKILDWAQQFTAGRHNMDKFTRTSMFAYHMPFGRIQEALSYLGIGLGPESTSSGLSLFGNMITKRYLPAMLGVGALGYLSWELGNLTGKTGQQWLYDLKLETREALAAIRDTFGITSLFKRAERLTPGSEMIWELPFLHFLDPTKSLEEVREEDEGVRPIRKGRFWLLGNTPYVGGKIEYYLPSERRLAYADYKMTDVLYGSREEYYKHAWFPTPRYPMCLLPEQLVFTDQGFFPVENIAFTANTINYKNEWTQIITKLERPASEFANEIVISGKQCFPLKVTSNHPVLVLRRESLFKTVAHRSHLRKDKKQNVDRWIRKQDSQLLESCLEWVEAKDVRPWDWVVSPKIKLKGETCVDISEYHPYAAITENWCYYRIKQDTAEFIELIESGKELPKDVKHTRTRERAKRHFRNGNIGRLPRKVSLDKDFGWFLGWYLAEGHTTNQLGSGNMIVLTMHKDEQEVAEGLLEIIDKKFGCRGSITEHGENTIRLLIGCSGLSSALKAWCGNSATTKKIPAFVWSSNYEFVKALIEGFVAGDGWSSEGKGNFCCSTSSSLILGIMALVEAIGYVPSIKRHSKAGKKEVVGKTCEVSESWTLSVPSKQKSSFTTENFVFRQVVKNNSFWYEGPVYDLEVDKEASFTTVSCIIHNSPIRHFITDPYHWERCVTEGTKIIKGDLTVTEIENINVGDEVLSHDGRPHKVLNKWSDEINESVVEVKVHGATSYPIKSTPEHRYLAIKAQHCPKRPSRSGAMCVPGKMWNKCKACNYKLCETYKIEWVRADELAPGDYIALPKVVLPEDLVEIKLNVEEKYWNGRSYTSGIRKKMPDVVPASEELFKLFGYYLAEGSTSERTVTFALCIDEDDIAEDIYNKIKNIFGIESTIHRDHDHNTIVVIASSSSLANAFRKLFGTGAKNKRIPVELLRAPKKCLIELIAGFFIGDGTCKSHDVSISATTISENLAIQLRQILMALGMPSSILCVDEKPPLRPNKTYFVNVDSYVANALREIIGWPINREACPSKYSWQDEDFIYFKIKSVETKQYKGKIYDLKIEDAHSFLGVNAVLHNTHYYSRPYPTTGPISEIADIPIAGPVLSATIGQLFKPTRRMHEEEMRQYASETSKQEIAALNQAEKDRAEGKNYAYITPAGDVSIVRDVGPAKNLIDLPGWGRGTSWGGYRVSGATGLGRTEIASLNEVEFIKASSKYSSLRERIFLPDRRGGQEAPPTLEGAVQTNSLQYIGAKTYYGLTEMAGIYGFLSQSITGQPIDEMKVLQDSSRMTSYSRAFWDLALGGFGGESSEIGRRFLPRERRYQQDLDINPIPNDMPSWMPGDNYFLNFRRGDPYSKISRGEARLPGGGYEALWDYHPQNLIVRASLVGKSEQEIFRKLLNIESSPATEEQQEVMEEGTEIHRAYQRMWRDKGILVSAEELVYDERARSTGHYDAILNIEGEPVVVDVKTLSQKRWEKMLKEGAFQEHIDQMTIYQHALGIKKAGIQYVNRDDLNQTVFIQFDYNKRNYERLVKKLDKVRETIYSMIDEGRISRYELYDPLHRFAILADVAPYSDEYKYYAKYVTQEYSDITGTVGPEREEKLRIKEFISETKKRVAQQKKKHRFFPYRFKYTDIVKQQVHVTEVIDNQTFLTREYPTTPIKLAGIRVSSAQDADEARAFIDRYIYPGSRLTIGVDIHEEERYTGDSIGSMAAVVFSRGKNLNLAMMKAGLAKEKKDDWSSAGVRARFSGTEIMLGSLWESFAHADTPFHTKFLPVASPLEQYKRRDVFGKSFQSWSIRDQLEPTISGIASKDILSAAISGGILGGLIYGTSLPKRLQGAKYGALLFAALSGARTLHDLFSDERWIPERRRKEREINEYFDILQYIKYRGMYEYASRRAKEEGFDVDKFYEELRKKQEINKKLRERLEAEKLELKLKQLPEKRKALANFKKDIERFRRRRDKEIEKIKNSKWEAVEEAEEKWRSIRERTPKWLRAAIDKARDRDIANIKESFDKREAERREFYRQKLKFSDYFQEHPRIREINKQLDIVAQNKELLEIPDWARIAIEYRKAAESTLYGADTGAGIGSVLGAMPSKEREYFVEFLNAKPEERKEILELVPRNMRRFLQASWGMKPEPKPDLEEYFKTHYLPGSGWEGWSGTKDLADIKVKVIRNEGLDLSEFGFWRQDVEKSEANNAPGIPINKPTFSGDELRRNLSEILSGIGLEDVDVIVQPSPIEGIQMDVHIDKDRRREIIDFVNNNIDILL